MLFEALLTYPSTGFCKTLFLLFSNFGALIQDQKAKNGQMDSWEHSSSLFDDMPLETRITSYDKTFHLMESCGLFTSVQENPSYEFR